MQNNGKETQGSAAMTANGGANAQASAASAKRHAPAAKPRPRTAQNRNHSRNVVVAAMLSAVAFVLMFIQFPIPMLIPAFVQMDISDLPALIGAFALSPIYGVVISLMKNILNLLIEGSTTAGVGEVSNFMLGAVFTYTAGFVYHHRRKTRWGAIIGASIGAVLMGIISVPMNFFVIYPTYEIAYGMPMTVILSMYQAILPRVETLFECLIIFNMPFTIVKGLLCVLICSFIYKPLSPLLHGKR